MRRALPTSNRMFSTIIASSSCRSCWRSKTNELANRAKAENDLAKAAKEAGATLKSSDLVGRDAQVPEIGALATTAPQLFDLTAGQISGPINTGHSGIVAKIT